MSTQTNIAWYYVGVLGLLLVGQNYVLKTAHKDQVAKLNAKLGAAPAVVAPASTSAAALSATLAQADKEAVAPPASTLTPAPTAQTAPANQPTMAAAKAAPATESQPAAKPAAEQKPITASAAPAKSKSSGKPVPVAFQFRSEPFQASKIVTLTNTSAQKLNCTVRVKRPATGESRSFEVTVGAAGEVRLMRSIQGWEFKTGDRIEVAQAGYKSRTASVP